MGDATIRDFLEVRDLLPAYISSTHIYIAVTSPAMVKEAMKIAEELRREHVSAAVDFGEKKLGDQLKAAAKHMIPYVMVVGEDELASNTFGVKDMATGEEKKLSRGGAGAILP